MRRILIVIAILFCVTWIVTTVLRLPENNRFQVVDCRGQAVWIDTKTGETKFLDYVSYGPRIRTVHPRVVIPLWE
jgi:hypothetical protein